MSVKVERISENLELGEGPHWDEHDQSLYFVDIPGKSIHKYVPSTKKHTKVSIGSDQPSIIIPVKGETNKFLVSVGRKLTVVTWDGESDTISETEELCELDKTHLRFNDGKCDPSGRLWIGTMNATDFQKADGYLTTYQNSQIKTHLTNLFISNGLAFNTEIKKMYFIDSHNERVDEYDFDVINGRISNGKPIFTLSKHGIPGFPDGMAIDSDGNLWVAIFNGERVIKIDPRIPDTLLETITLPAKQVTSVAFGGPNLTELYVTTGKIRFGGAELSGPVHGATYRVTGINARGLPGVRVVL